MRLFFSSDSENEKVQRIWEIMKNKGADLNARGRLGEAPIHQAVGRNNLRAVEWLLASNADINSTNKYESVTLHCMHV